MLLGKIKLYDIAKEFDMSSKDILAIAVKLNIDAKSHLSSVSDEDAERIRKEAKNTNKTKQNNVKKDSKKLAELGARLFRFKKAYESIDSKQNALKKKIEAIRYEI